MNIYLKLLTVIFSLVSVIAVSGQTLRTGKPLLLKSEVKQLKTDSLQETTKHRLGFWGGYDFLQHSVDNQLFRFLPGFKSCCTGFNQVTTGNGLAMGLLYEMAFFNALSFEDNLQFRISYRTLNAQLSEDEYLGKIRNPTDNTLIDLSSRHTLDATASFLTFEPRYSIKPTRLPFLIGVGIEGGIGMGDISAMLDEKLIDSDDNVTYIDQNGNTIGSTFRRVDSTLGSDRRNSLFINGVTLSFAIPIPLTERIKVTPEFTYYMQLPFSQSSLLKQLPEIENNRVWTVQTMRAGLSLQYELGSKPSQIMLIEDYIRRDTIEYISATVTRDSVVLVNENLNKEVYSEKVVNTLVQNYSLYKKIEKPKRVPEDTSPETGVVTKSSITERNIPLPKEWKTVKKEETLRDSITCSLVKDSTIQREKILIDSSTYTKTILTTYQKVTSSYKTKPDKIDTLNGKLYYTYIKTDTVTKEKGILRDSIYLEDEVKDNPEPCTENGNIFIVNIEREYIKLVPCKVEQCKKFEKWNWQTCECNENIGNNEIQIVMRDRKGTPVGDTVYYSTKRNQKTRYIFPYVFFNYGSSQIKKEYDDIGEDLRVLKQDVENHEYDNPIHKTGLLRAKEITNDTIFLIGSKAKEESNKNLADEREKFFVDFLTKPQSENGYGLPITTVVSSKEFEQKQKKKRNKTELKRYSFVTQIAEYLGLNEKFNQHVYIVSPKGLEPKVVNTEDIDIISPDTFVVKPKAGLNNYFKGNVIITSNNFTKQNNLKVDTMKGYALSLRQEKAKRIIVENVRSDKKNISVTVSYDNGQRAEDNAVEPPIKKFYTLAKISSQEKMKRSIADSMIYQNEVFIPFFIFGDIDNDNTPRNTYEKDIVDSLRKQITSQSKVILEVSPLMPEDRIVEIKKLFSDQSELTVKKRINKSSQSVRRNKTWNQLVNESAIELVKESRVTITIITPM